MSDYQEAGWLRRLWSIARPGAPFTEHVQNVQLVNDAKYRGSRERAPYGRIIAASPAPAAVEFAGWELRADDNLSSPIVLLRGLRAFVVGGGSIIASIQAPTAALIADRTAASFIARDRDPDVTLTVNSLSTAGGDLPATPFVVPPDFGVTAAWASIVPWVGLDFALHWQNGESLFLWGFTADAVVSLDATIQAIRS